LAVRTVKIREGLYLFQRQDCSVSITDAIQLVHALIADISSDTPHIHWGYHPDRSNLGVFLGTGLDNGKNAVIIAKRTIKGNIEFQFEFFEGAIATYSVTDLCFEQEKSFLMELYAQVAPRVFERSLTHRTGGRMLRETYPE
jgi:hypothetical protein